MSGNDIETASESMAVVTVVVTVAAVVVVVVAVALVHSYLHLLHPSRLHPFRLHPMMILARPADHHHPSRIVTLEAMSQATDQSPSGLIHPMLIRNPPVP